MNDPVRTNLLPPELVVYRVKAAASIIVTVTKGHSSIILICNVILPLLLCL